MCKTDSVYHYVGRLFRQLNNLEECYYRLNNKPLPRTGFLGSRIYSTVIDTHKSLMEAFGSPLVMDQFFLYSNWAKTNFRDDLLVGVEEYMSQIHDLGGFPSKKWCRENSAGRDDVMTYSECADFIIGLGASSKYDAPILKELREKQSPIE